MTTTARHHIGRIAATVDPDLIEAVIYSGYYAGYKTCQICDLAAELYARIDNRDGDEIEVCADCAETADVTPLPDCD